MAKYLKLSDTTLKEKTGKDWSGWIAIIDGFGGATMDHKEIAAKLFETYGTQSSSDSNDSDTGSASKQADPARTLNGWWCQSITVGYEYAKGRRVLGQTKDAGFEIGVTKKLAVTPDKLWSFLVSQPGLTIWLGKVEGLKITPGAQYKTFDGTSGEVRTLAAGKRLRMTWQPAGWPTPARLQLSLTASGNGTTLGFHQEKLESAKQRDVMRSHWQDVLFRLEKQFL